MTERIPEAFLCPLSGKVFRDPVVMVPDGTTHERSSILTSLSVSDQKKWYPNRALQRMIEESVVFPEDDETDDHWDWLECLRRKGRIPVLQPPLNDDDREGGESDGRESHPTGSHDGPWYRPPAHIPSELLCPISSDLLLDPVIDPEGHSYDRQSLNEWLRSHRHRPEGAHEGTGTSPMTRQPLSEATLVPNLAVQQFLRDELSRPEASCSEMIREWKRDEAVLRKRNRRRRLRLRRTWRQMSREELLLTTVMWTVLLGLAFLIFYFVGRDSINFQRSF